MIKVREALFVLALTIMSASANAGTISYAGLELVTLSGVTFPTAEPVTSGSSIQFTAGGRSKLLSLGLFSAGELSSQLPEPPISLIFALTVVGLVASRGCLNLKYRKLL